MILQLKKTDIWQVQLVIFKVVLHHHLAYNLLGLVFKSYSKKTKTYRYI